MSNSKKTYQIIFIYRDKLFFCNSSQQKSAEFLLTSEVVKDLEVIDQVKLETSLGEFLGKSGENFGETVIILNKNTYFETTIENPELDPVENKAKIDEFSDLVPFNDIFVKQFTLHKKLEVVAINREFYEPILDVLYKLKFKITMILPDLVVKNLVGEASCSPEENSALIKALGKLGPYDLLGSKHKLITKDAQIEPIKIQNRRLVALSATFGVLILVLVGAIVFNANRTYEEDYIVDEQPIFDDVIDLTDKKIEVATSEAILEEKTSTPSAILEIDQYKIRVLNGSGISGQAGIVRRGLEEVGFEDIDVGNAQKISSNKTQILLIPTLPTEIRTLVLDVVENLDQEYTIQESSELNYDIVITTTAAE